jgi:hypothetical protein
MTLFLLGQIGELALGDTQKFKDRSEVGSSRDR